MEMKARVRTKLASISNQQHPIADLDYHFALSFSLMQKDVPNRRSGVADR
jgi:hypothetical protein